MPDRPRLPLFPLHTVLFPGAVLPLHVFEQRYRQLVQEGRDFGIVLIREGREVGSVPQVHPVGTIAHLDEVTALPDGRFNVNARGLGRFRIVRLHEPDPYLLADVEELDDAVPAGGTRLLSLVDTYLELHGLEISPALSLALGKRAVWLVGSIMQAEPWKRQRLLESGDPAVAEELLEGEIAKLQELGGLAPVSPLKLSPN